MKEHLVGGTLRTVMVNEVLRALKANKGNVDRAAAELGITSRTLRHWKNKWPELAAYAYQHGMQHLDKALKQPEYKHKQPKKRVKLKSRIDKFVREKI